MFKSLALYSIALLPIPKSTYEKSSALLVARASNTGYTQWRKYVQPFL